MDADIDKVTEMDRHMETRHTKDAHTSAVRHDPRSLHTQAGADCRYRPKF